MDRLELSTSLHYTEQSPAGVPGSEKIVQRAKKNSTRPFRMLFARLLERATPSQPNCERQTFDTISVAEVTCSSVLSSWMREREPLAIPQKTHSRRSESAGRSEAEIRIRGGDSNYIIEGIFLQRIPPTNSMPMLRGRLTNWSTGLSAHPMRIRDSP